MNNGKSSIVRRDTNVSGVNPRRPVTHEELTKHNTRYVRKLPATSALIDDLSSISFRESCWVAFNGMVYNCTPYMEYHPGGGDELMKSAGKLPNYPYFASSSFLHLGDDGTQLFHQVHRWVNLERILKPCLIGPYVRPPGSGPNPNQLQPGFDR